MWYKGLVEWLTPSGVANISAVFSWQVQKAYQRAAWLNQQGYLVRVGGPAIALALQSQPAMFDRIAATGDHPFALRRHNIDATFTSRGCIRSCPFCIVPKVEGDLREIPLIGWQPKPIICDNNLLACSRRHFDNVIDRLKPLAGIDFNQGLDARLLTPYHAGRIAELDLACVRLAWDHVNVEGPFMRAFILLRKAGIRKAKLRAYVLIGFDDTPDDALYRLRSVRKLGIDPYPMRYQPIDATKRNEYVAPAWSQRELFRFTRYWSRLRWLAGIPFEEYSQEKRSNDYRA